jgi:ethanolamine transporter EutH
MRKMSVRKLLIQISLAVAGAIAGGYVGPYTTDQSEMFFAASMFFGVLGGLLGLVVARALFHKSEG